MNLLTFLVVKIVLKTSNTETGLKAEKSRKNGIKLIYINYWESITPSLIKERVEEALK